MPCMLITTKLNDCPGCKDLDILIQELDCYIASESSILLYNYKLSFNKFINRDNVRQAVRLKRILVARTHNPQYAGNTPIQDIINKVKRTIYGL